MADFEAIKESLRSGLTTGTCAAAAAKAGVMVLCGLRPPGSVEVRLPDMSIVSVPLKYARYKGDGAEAAVQKDAGDDPDITNGVTVVVHVAWAKGDENIFSAGPGVGTVTLPGLAVACGEPAINPVPRKMIQQAVEDVTRRSIELSVSIPGGETLAKNTFNPRLGIEGGLSILGTTGRVSPRSSAALKATLACCLDVAIACKIVAPVLVPGNIGRRAAMRHFNVSGQQVIEVSNEWGYALGQAQTRPFEYLLIVGHPGKLAKVTIGHWDTHSLRSSSAVSVVNRLVSERLELTLPYSTTVEGLMSALSENDRQVVACLLATEVRCSVLDKIRQRFDVAVALIDLAGNVLGSDGDFGPWLKLGT